MMRQFVGVRVDLKSAHLHQTLMRVGLPMVGKEEPGALSEEARDPRRRDASRLAA